jgi:hypothetical protein
MVAVMGPVVVGRTGFGVVANTTVPPEPSGAFGPGIMTTALAAELIARALAPRRPKTSFRIRHSHVFSPASPGRDELIAY